MTSAGEERTVTSARITITLVALLLPLRSNGQETPGPPRFLLLVESTVATEDSADWAGALAQAAAGHARHPKGRAWAAYRELTGGPDESVRFFFPLQRMAELDDWKSNREVLTRSLGPDRAGAVLEDLDLAADSGERVLSYSGKLSRPWPDFQAPRYLWVEEFLVAEGRMVEYASLAKRLVDAFEQAGESTYWVAYGNAIGGDSSELHFYYGFDAFAELDSWTSRLEVLDDIMAEGEAGRLLAAIEAISETRSSLWQLEPELSQLEGE
jgi:hypothetical protein